MTLHNGIPAVCAALFLLLTDAASANSRRYNEYWPVSRHVGPYATALIGGALGGDLDFDGDFEVDLASGFLVGATVGYDNMFAGAAGDVRMEAELSYRSQDLKGFRGDVGLTAVLANGWYDFDLGGRVVPYLGVGLGIGFIGNDVADDDAGLAFQLGGGFNYHLNYRLLLGFNYRYLLTDLGSELDYSGHQLSVSVGYKF